MTHRLSWRIESSLEFGIFIGGWAILHLDRAPTVSSERTVMRKGYAHTLLVDFSTVKGEFPPILKIRSYRLKITPLHGKYLDFPSNLRRVKIPGRFVRFLLLPLLLLLRSKKMCFQGK